MNRGVETSECWGSARRVAFRFVFAYFAFFATTFPGVMLPFALKFEYFGLSLWDGLVPWFSSLFLGVEVAPEPMSAGGDTLFNYVQVLFGAAIALVAACVWSIVDWRRPAYPRLAEALRICVRFVLAITLLSYGFHKVFNEQFPPIGADRLMQTYGESSPSGLLWTFMGFSPAYVFFSGAAEVLGATLLLFRRTTTLGALVLIGVLANVVMLNFCYDVGVKLFSMHLLAMAVYLVTPDASRLANLLVLNRTAAPAAHASLLAPGWKRIAARSVWIAAACYAFFGNAWEYGSSWHMRPGMNSDAHPDCALTGRYVVEKFTRDGVEVPALITEKDRWHRTYLAPGCMFSVRMTDGSRQYAGTLTNDPEALMANIHPGMVITAESENLFRYTQPEPGTLIVSGKCNGSELVVVLRKENEQSFMLTSRGFSWAPDHSLFNQ